MTIDRRNFLKAAGTLALAGLANGIPFGNEGEAAPQSPTKRLRVALFREPGFPSVDIAPIDAGTLKKVLANCEIIEFNSQNIAALLDSAAIDVYLHPYGSAFPMECFEPIRNFLAKGGCWVNLGGVPFSVPMRNSGAGRVAGELQTGYHQKLGITQAYPVSSRLIDHYAVNEQAQEPVNLLNDFSAESIFELYVRLTSSKSIPEEDGSDGPRDAILTPLVFGIGRDGKRRAAPIIQLDRIKGEYAGGRWIFVNIKGKFEPDAIGYLVDLAARGATEFIVKPSYACYREGEVSAITVSLNRPGAKKSSQPLPCSVVVTDMRRNQVVAKQQLSLESGPASTASSPLEILPGAALHPGFFLIEASAGNAEHPLRARSGFWFYDATLMSSGLPLRAGKEYLLREGKPYPVTGTTYMASDAHRQFLFEPNPFVWDHDFAEMKRSGINMVRTGIWTGWKNYMTPDGKFNEGTLRAFDAFLHSARQYDIPVIFTLFAFLPETWGGVNPFLDPQAIKMQKVFINAFAQRYAQVNDLLWDFINEPSFSSAKQIWNCRPNYDEYETAAWQAWLETKYPASSRDELIAILSETYRLPSAEALNLPPLEEFDDANIFGTRAPLRTVDYCLFAQDAFRDWAREMAGVVRNAAGNRQLVTVGQDEGGTSSRPTPQFFGDAIDFTSVHNWWYNDDLIWDNVMTGVPGKPNLVEETGVMFYEQMDGMPWRSEGEVASLLERKLAVSLGAGAAGFIEWIWNTNPFMPSDNEAAIGLYRPDGTAKPELDVVEKFTAFFSANRQLMEGREQPDVVMVIPHANLFSPRNTADEAARRCVRAVCCSESIPLAGVSEYRFDRLAEIPKLLLLPAPAMLSNEGWKKIERMVRQGATLAIAGPFDDDEHCIPAKRMEELGLSPLSQPVTAEEILYLEDPSPLRLTYHGQKMHRLRKSVAKDGNPLTRVVVMKHGTGSIIWSPLPVENADALEPAELFYRFVFRKSGINSAVLSKGKDSSVTVLPTIFKDAVLITMISESDRDCTLDVTVRETGKTLHASLKAGRTALAFLRRVDGEVLASMGEFS